MSRRPPTRAWAFVGGILLLAGCDDYGVPATTTLDEPIQVSGTCLNNSTPGQFFPGPIPVNDAGVSDAGSSDGGDGGAAGPPKVDTINTMATEVFAGQASEGYSGDADPGSYAVLTRFADLGTGYWSVPVCGPDSNAVTPGALSWSENLSYASDIPAGTYDLQFAAVDANGNVGPTNDLMILVTSPVPAGAAVVSLTWDSAADLDLHLVAPDGTELDPQHPTTAAALEADGGLPPGTAVLDRDSNGACVEDGFREEDAVFATPPAPGTYLVRVDMFSACGAPSADFVVRVRVEGKVVDTVKGRLLAMDADGGGPGSGLFVAQLSF